MLVLLVNSGQGVTSSDIAEAIAQGAAGHVLQASCSAFAFDADQVRSGYQVVVSGPLGRIMAAAKDAHEQQLPFGAADVTDAMRAPVLTVAPEMIMPLGLHIPGELPSPTGIPDAYTRIVLGSAATKDPPPAVLEPIDMVVSTSSLELRVFRGTSAMTGQPLGPEPIAAIFRFDLTAFRAMPDADIEVVLITKAYPSGGYSCKIGSENRTLLR
jgi:hypothetical protein